MIVTFKTSMPLEETMGFEDVYEDALQMQPDEKAEILRDGIAVWMFVDGELAGESYGASAALFDEEIEDVTTRDPRTMYCFSTTVLPEFQGRGLSKILCAYWLGLVTQAGYRMVLGHTTAPAMKAVKAFFGATFSTRHERWGGTRGLRSSTSSRYSRVTSALRCSDLG